MREVVPKQMNLLRWNLTDKCNYQCSYCITSSVKNKNSEVEIVPLRFVNRFSEILSGSWNVSLEGLGEPFCAPDFLNIVKRLVDKGFYISITTNFSFSRSEIYEFIRIAGDRLLCMGVSLHLDYVNPIKFLEKVEYFQNIIPGKLLVKYVATKKGIALLPRISKRLKKKNIGLLVNAERIRTKQGLGHSRKYSKREVNKIKSCTPIFWQDFSFEGRLCWTGHKTFVVQKNGEAFRCASARTDNVQSGMMGNIFDKSFRLFSKPTPCTTSNCYCSYSWLFA